MKKSSITLKQFIKNFSIKPFDKIISGDIPDNFKDLSYQDKYGFIGHYKTIMYLRCDENHISFGIAQHNVKRSGNRIYISRGEIIRNIYITSKIVKASDGSIVGLFLKMCNISIFPKESNISNLAYFLQKPAIFRAIITGHIYNLETWYKRIASICYGIKDVDWRTIQVYFQNWNKLGLVSLLDIYCFTKNAKVTINRLVNSENISEMCDLIKGAIRLNQIVDLSWSDKRIKLEHANQIQKILKMEISNKDDKPIYENCEFSDKSFELLNTESRIFKESEAMHNCLYSCYYERIRHKKYIAFHKSYPETCTIGIIKNNLNEICIEQARGVRNSIIKESTMQIIKEFVNKNQSILKNMFDSTESTKVEIDSPF